MDGTSVLCHCWSQNIFSSVNLKDSVTLSKPLWSDLLLEPFNIQWLDALYASTICWFSPQMPCAGIFLELEEFDSNQPLPEFFCRCHVLVWYPWSSNLARRYEHLALLLHQLQEGTTILTKFPHPSTSTPMSSPLPFAGSSSTPMPSLPPVASLSTQMHITWVEIISRHKRCYEERVKRETPKD